MMGVAVSHYRMFYPWLLSPLLLAGDLLGGGFELALMFTGRHNFIPDSQ